MRPKKFAPWIWRVREANANLMSASCNNRDAIVPLRPLRNSADSPNVNSIDALDYRANTTRARSTRSFRGERAACWSRSRCRLVRRTEEAR